MSRRPLVQARERAARRAFAEHITGSANSLNERQRAGVTKALGAAFDSGLAYAISCAIELREKAAGENPRDWGQRRAATRLVEELGGDVD